MKKQIFLLSLSLLFAGEIFSSCCNTTTSSSSCGTSCSTSTSCNNTCTPEWGHTYMQLTPRFQTASPELVAGFNSDMLYNLERDDKHGMFQVTVFGGKNTKQSQAAAYFLPYGQTTLTFDGSVSNDGAGHTFAQVLAESDIYAAVTGATTGINVDEVILNGAGGITNGASAGQGGIASDPATYKFDTNANKGKILPWNFGITFAALFEPLGASASGARAGTGLITNPAFTSTICPKWTVSNVGAGLMLRYQFSDDKQGFFGQISTAIQNVKSCFTLNETPGVAATPIDSDNFPAPALATAFGAVTTAVNPYGVILDTPTTYISGFVGADNTMLTNNNSANGQNEIATLAINGSGALTLATTDPSSSILTAYTAAASQAGAAFPAAVNTDTVVPTSVAQAFSQDAWLYGKVSTCAQKITRLADIELSLGYQWFCGDCASTNWFVGIVIPTGNKPCATYIAPAVVGNGGHVGIVTGSTTQVMLSDSADYTATYRIDTSFRYLFRNTQKRSFDLLGNSWSRYMMVWPNKETYTAAVAAMNGNTATNNANRVYSPGINSFTQEFYIKPQFQGRINQAVYFQSEHFRAELGWGVFARQTDCVQLACDWNSEVAFADYSYLGGVGLNRNRTIYNDSQTTCYNAIDAAGRTNSAATSFITLGNVALADTNYDDFVIGSDQIDYQSIATPNAIVNTPYLQLGYAFESDYKPVLAIGASYDFTTRNSALNQWLVWGKFELAF